MQGPEPVLLMTRPRAQAERFVALLQDLCARFQVIYSPLIDIRFAGALPDLSGIATLVFTSANGVAAWQAAGGGRDLPCYTVGARTADAARAAGLQAISADGDAEALLALILTDPDAAPLLHIRGTHSRGNLAQRLSAQGLPCREAVLYDQPEIPLTAEAAKFLHGPHPVVAPVFSPRSARLLAQNAVKAPLLVAGISQAVSKALAPLHIYDLRIAPRPESRAMLSLCAELLARAGAEGGTELVDRRTGTGQAPDLKG